MVLRCKKLLLRKIQKGEIQDEIINNNLLKETEIKVIKMMLAKKFTAEIRSLGPRKYNRDGLNRLMGNLRIARLDPFLDKYDVLRVGSRLCESYLNNSCMHPALLPKE